MYYVYSISHTQMGHLKNQGIASYITRVTNLCTESHILLSGNDDLNAGFNLQNDMHLTHGG